VLSEWAVESRFGNCRRLRQRVDRMIFHQPCGFSALRRSGNMETAA
jgi:hypothetical protein